MFLPKELGNGRYKFQCMQCNEPLILEAEDKVHVNINEHGEIEGTLCDKCFEEDDDE